MPLLVMILLLLATFCFAVEFVRTKALLALGLAFLAAAFLLPAIDALRR